MSLPEIKIKDPQPVPCPRCGGFEGYQYSDLYRMSYTSVHTAEGEYEGGEYNSGTNLNKGKIPYCANCGARLPFKLRRTEDETVE